MTNLDTLVRDRSRIAVFMAVAFTVWQGGQIATQLLNPNTDGYQFAVAGAIIGAVAFVITALLLYLFQRRVKKAKLAETLNDEWAEHVKAKSIQFGFFCQIGATALFYAASTFLKFPAQAALQGLIIIGVVSTIFGFVWNERKSELAQ